MPIAASAIGLEVRVFVRWPTSTASLHLIRYGRRRYLRYPPSVALFVCLLVGWLVDWLVGSFRIGTEGFRKRRFRLCLVRFSFVLVATHLRTSRCRLSIVCVSFLFRWPFCETPVSPFCRCQFFFVCQLQFTQKNPFSSFFCLILRTGFYLFWSEIWSLI